MYKLSFAAIALLPILAAPAAAADMPVKAPSAPPAYYDWTGFYFGVNAGYGVAGDPTSVVTNTGGPASTNNETFGLSPSGALGGIQAGYNWQTGHVVLGAEVDWQLSGQKNSACVLNCTFNFSLSETQQISSIGTARLRLGYAADHWLWYATGGLVWARIHEGQALQENVTVVIPPVSAAGVTAADSARAGWVLGAGVETAISGNWTAKLEYLHADLGHVTNTFTTILPGLLGPPFPFNVTTNSTIRDNIIRAGLNYRFAPGHGAPAAEPTAAVAYDWTGLYAGVNAGYALGRSPSSETDFGVAGIAPPLLSNDTFKLLPNGGLAGGQAGYNWQAGNIVVGVEADWQWTHQNDSACVEGCILPAGQALAVSQTLDWLATVRARAGYAYHHWLWYVTGGAAWAHEQNSVSFNDSVASGSATAAGIKSGWVAGTGVETVLWGNWSAKFEYLYVSLPGSVENFTLPLGNGVVLNITGRSDLKDNIFRAGLNYKFGPLSAR